MTPGLWRWCLVISAVWLAGCSTPSLRPTASTSAAATFWSGRLVLEIDHSPPQNLSAQFELLGSEQQGELLLLSPLGTSLGRLRWQPGLAQLDRGDQHWQGESVQELTEQLTGTAMPLGALFEWLDGRARSEAGWQVNLEQLQSLGRLTAERQQPEPQARLKLQLDR